MSRDDAQEMVTITKIEYDILRNDAFKLACLSEWGVDNWECYSDAMHDYHKEKGNYE
jgi:hypothetical protein